MGCGCGEPTPALSGLAPGPADGLEAPCSLPENQVSKVTYLRGLFCFVLKILFIDF